MLRKFVILNSKNSINGQNLNIRSKLRLNGILISFKSYFETQATILKTSRMSYALMAMLTTAAT